MNVPELLGMWSSFGFIVDTHTLQCTDPPLILSYYPDVQPSRKYSGTELLATVT
jgi:hypothetical protein